MLTIGLDHVATITKNADRLIEFYVHVFGATVERDGPEFPGGPRMVILNVGATSELNVFEIDGNHEAEQQTPMFGRGRIDHNGLQAADLGSFEEIRRRLVATSASDGGVTEFGRKISIFFRDPDAMECEVLFDNPDVDEENLRFGTPLERYA